MASIVFSPPTRVGERVRLFECRDEYTVLPHGLMGTADYIDDAGTVFVRWDNGSTLGLVPGIDSWEVLR